MGIKSDFWRPHVSAWRGSGLSQAAYCRRHGLDVKRLAYWQRVLDESQAPATSALVPIRLQEPVAGDGRIEVCLRNGLRVWLSPGTAPMQLVPLLRALGTC